FSLLAYIRDQKNTIPECPAEIGIGYGPERLCDREQGGKAGAVIGHAWPAHIPVAIDGDIVFQTGRENGIEVGGDRDKRSGRVRLERSQNIARTIDSSVPAERAELGGHPFRALLLHEGRGRN